MRLNPLNSLKSAASVIIAAVAVTIIALVGLGCGDKSTGNGGYVSKEPCHGGIIQNLCDADEYPAHQVTVSSFYIAKFEVTTDLWLAIMDDYPKASFEEGQKHLSEPNYPTNWEFVI